MSNLNRMMDLHALVQRYYYHPKFRGSFSLKSVLPALIPEMSYNDLAIKDGREASSLYLKMLNPDSNSGEWDKIKGDLLNYCRRDTLALVKIRERFSGKGDKITNINRKHIMVFDTNNPNNIEDHPEHDQDKIDPDFISEITDRLRQVHWTLWIFF